MKIAIVYDSLTGTTASAALQMAEAFRIRGHTCAVSPVRSAKPDEVSKADLICVGSWTRGLLLFAQHATRETMGFLEKLGDLGGKKAIVFCTYKVATGKMLPQMAAPLRQKGAEVLATFKFRTGNPGGDFASFVATLPS